MDTQKLKPLLYAGGIAVAVYVLYKYLANTPQVATGQDSTSGSGAPNMAGSPLGLLGFSPAPQSAYTAPTTAPGQFNIGGNSFGGLQFGGSPVSINETSAGPIGGTTLFNFGAPANPSDTGSGCGSDCGCDSCTTKCSSANAHYPDGRGACMAATVAQVVANLPATSLNNLAAGIADNPPTDPYQLFPVAHYQDSTSIAPPVGPITYF